MFFRCPSIQAHCNEAVIYLNFGTPKNNKFSIWNKWKIYYFLGVPILKHIRVFITDDLVKTKWLGIASDHNQT